MLPNSVTKCRSKIYSLDRNLALASEQNNDLSDYLSDRWVNVDKVGVRCAAKVSGDGGALAS